MFTPNTAARYGYVPITNQPPVITGQLPIYQNYQQFSPANMQTNQGFLTPRRLAMQALGQQLYGPQSSGGYQQSFQNPPPVYQNFVPNPGYANQNFSLPSNAYQNLPQPVGLQKPPADYNQVGITTPNGSRYYNRIVREKDGKIDVINSRSDSNERAFAVTNTTIFRSDIPATKVSNNTICYFNPKSTQPVATVTIGNWTGRAMIDTGSNKSIVSDKFISQIGVPIMKDRKAERVNTICGLVSFDKRILADVTLMGYKVPKWEITVVADSPALNNNDFDAIIGAEFMYKLPPMVIDIYSGMAWLVEIDRRELSRARNSTVGCITTDKEQIGTVCTNVILSSHIKDHREDIQVEDNFPLTSRYVSRSKKEEKQVKYLPSADNLSSDGDYKMPSLNIKQKEIPKQARTQKKFRTNQHFLPKWKQDLRTPENPTVTRRGRTIKSPVYKDFIQH